MIRQYIGPAFSGSAAKKLVSLRRDFSKKEREECKKHCEEAIKSYKGTKSENCSGFFNLLGEKITKIDKEKKILKKISEENCGNNILERNDTNDNLDIDNNVDKGCNIDEDKKQKWTVVKSDLGEFLKDFSDGDDEVDNKKKIKNINNENDNINEVKEKCDIDYEGFLHKKAFQFYKKFYFQIKNDSLYMFKNNISNIILNKFPLKNIDKVIDYKERKFILKILEKFKEENNNMNNMNNDNNNNVKKNKKYFREHKFKCENKKEKQLWIIAISKAIKKAKNEINIQTTQKIEIKEYKLIINDFFNLKNIKIDEPYMQIKVLSSLIEEDNFPIIPSKIKSVRKSIKKKKEEEKKNQIKEDKSVGNKIKSWFKIGFNTNEKNNDK
jgi:hypothetical protein